MRLIRRAPSAVLALIVAAGCGSSGTPEDEVRALVDQAETAAEERNASTLRGFIADDYQDGAGRSAADVRAILHGWLVAHPSVHLITRIDSIEIEGKELARARVTVGMLGREAGDDWALAGDVYRFDLRLVRDDGDWRVIAASRQDGG